jgi:nicotinate dehydrogenase subunit A
VPELTVNGRRVDVPADADTPLLYILRNDLDLKSPRFGCGEGVCGACTVLLDGRPATSCDLPVWAAAGHEIVTIEGLGDEARPHPIQRAILDEQAAQCGYCLTGVLLHGAALLAARPHPTQAEIRAALDAVLCRCGAHDRMIRAIERAASVSSVPS